MSSRSLREEFTTERLSIRAPHPRFAQELHAAIEESFENLKEWMPWAQRRRPLEEVEAHQIEFRRRFLAQEEFQLLLFLKGTDTLVGGSGLHRMDWQVPRFEVGYWARDSFVGMGLISEAVAGISRQAFLQLGAKRVEVCTSAANERSRGIPERLGFVQEAVLRNHRREMDGSIGDTVIYSLLPDECLEPVSTKK